MLTARKALEKSGKGGIPLRYRQHEPESFFVDLKLQIFPMVGPVVAMGSQGKFPFPRSGPAYKGDILLASELDLRRRGELSAFGELDDIDDSGGLDGTILGRASRKMPAGQEPRFGLMAMQARGLAMVGLLGGAGRENREDFGLSASPSKVERTQEKPKLADSAVGGAGESPVVPSKGHEITEAQATVERFQEALQETESLVSQQRVDSSKLEASIVTELFHGQLAHSEAEAQEGVLKSLQAVGLRMGEEMRGTELKLTESLPMPMHDRNAEKQKITELLAGQQDLLRYVVAVIVHVDGHETPLAAFADLAVVPAVGEQVSGVAVTQKPATTGELQLGNLQPGKQLGEVERGPDVADVPIPPPIVEILASELPPKTVKLGGDARDFPESAEQKVPESAREKPGQPADTQLEPEAATFQILVAAKDVGLFVQVQEACRALHAEIEAETLEQTGAGRVLTERLKASLLRMAESLEMSKSMFQEKALELKATEARLTLHRNRAKDAKTKLAIIEGEKLQAYEELSDYSDALAQAKKRLRQINIDAAVTAREGKAARGHDARVQELFQMTPGTPIIMGTSKMIRTKWPGTFRKREKDDEYPWHVAKTVSDVKWASRTTMPSSEWGSYRPEVAFGLLQEWGALMYSFLVIYFDGALSEVFDEFPAYDGFGVLERIRKTLRIRSEILEERVLAEWNALEMDFGFPGSRCTFAQLEMKAKDLVRKYNEVRVADAAGKYTQLGTMKQWRHVLTKKLARRFDELQQQLRYEEERNGPLSNADYVARITKHERNELAKGTKAFQPAPKGFKFAFVKKKSGAQVTAQALVAEGGYHRMAGERQADGYDWTLASGSGPLAGSADSSQAPNDKCHIHPDADHKNSECYVQHPERAPGGGSRGRGGGRGSGRGRGRGGRGKRCYGCGKFGHVQRECTAGGGGGNNNASAPVNWRGGRKLKFKELKWCKDHARCFDCGGDHASSGCEATEADCKTWKSGGIHTALGTGNGANNAAQGQEAHTAVGAAPARAARESKFESFMDFMMASGVEHDGNALELWGQAVKSLAQKREAADTDSGTPHAFSERRRAPRDVEAMLATSDHDVQTGGGNGGSSGGSSMAAATSGQDVKVTLGGEDNQAQLGQFVALCKTWMDKEKFGKSEAVTSGATKGKEEVSSGNAKVSNSLSLRDEMQQHKEGWSVNMLLPVASLGEVLARPKALVLFRQKSEMRLRDPHSLEWTVETQADVQSAINSAGVRVPTADKGQDAEALSLMRWDLAQAFARVVHDKYTAVAIPLDLQEACKSGAAAKMLEQLVTYKCGDGTNDLPGFMNGLDFTELLREHEERLQHPKTGTMYFAVGAGIGGGALAARGGGCKEKNMVLLDACDEHCDQLEVAFPEALVLRENVYDEEARRKIRRELRGRVGLMEACANCQPSVDMLKVHDADDGRHKLGRVAVSMADDVQPLVFVLEDVVGLRRNQPAEFKELKRLMGKVFKRVEVLEYNARHAMVGQNRNRLFFVCTNDVDIEPALRAVARQKLCYKTGGKTHPSMREMLQPYINLRGVKAVFIPHLQYAPKGADGRPLRLRDIDTYCTTITSNYGVRGGLSVEAWTKYKAVLTDFATKAQSIRLDGKHWGVLNGFSINTSYSKAKGHDCPTCTTPGGRSRGVVADIERGNVIVPAQAMLIYGPLIRAIANHGNPSSDGARSAAAFAAFAKMFTLAERWRAMGSPEDDLAAAADDAVAPGGSAEYEPSSTLFDGGVVTTEQAKDIIAAHKQGVLTSEQAIIAAEAKMKQLENATSADDGGAEVDADTKETAGTKTTHKKGVDTAHEALRPGYGVSDKKALAFVRLVHQRRGCRPVRLIKRDLLNGNLEGPHITNEQFENMDFKCETCMRTMQRRGPVRRRALKQAREPKRILEEVAVDVVGPRRRPSLRYHTGMGAAVGGANRYFVLFVDSPRATSRLFIAFASEKAQLEGIVRDTRRRMEIEAKSSVEYDGKHPIKVGCWKSDRDSNLTSE